MWRHMAGLWCLCDVIWRCMPVGVTSHGGPSLRVWRHMAMHPCRCDVTWRAVAACVTSHDDASLSVWRHTTAVAACVTSPAERRRWRGPLLCGGGWGRRAVMGASRRNGREGSGRAALINGGITVRRGTPVDWGAWALRPDRVDPTGTRTGTGVFTGVRELETWWIWQRAGSNVMDYRVSNAGDLSPWWYVISGETCSHNGLIQQAIGKGTANIDASICTLKLHGAVGSGLESLLQLNEHNKYFLVPE